MSQKDEDASGVLDSVAPDHATLTAPAGGSPPASGGGTASSGIGSRGSGLNALTVGLIVAVAAAAFLGGVYAGGMDSDQITQQDLDEAVKRLELKMLQGQSPEPPVRISIDDDPIIGDPDAPISIIEFSDFQCPFCARFHAQTLPALMEEYIDQGKAKLVFRDFPIQRIHPNAVPASAAAECADDQDMFKAMHDVLFDRQGQWSDMSLEDALATFNQYADELGMNQEEFDECVKSGRHLDDIRGDLEDGRSYGVEGTPGFFVGNDEVGYVSIPGAQPFESFKRVIDAQLGI